MKAIYGMVRASPRKKNLLFLIGYESLFTMFPQLWINETKRKRGEKSLRIRAATATKTLN
jgi:hypothetical protein